MMIERVLIFILFILGLYGLIGRDNLVKKIMGLSICSGAVVLLFVLEGAAIGSTAPIIVASRQSIVDPVPQALMLTAIVIGVCLSSLAMALAYRLYQAYGTFNLRTIRHRINHDKH
jgi:multicomponent Na+:H+ antiporter subunit C